MGGTPGPTLRQQLRDGPVSLLAVLWQLHGLSQEIPRSVNIIVYLQLLTKIFIIPYKMFIMRYVSFKNQNYNFIIIIIIIISGGGADPSGFAV